MTTLQAAVPTRAIPPPINGTPPEAGKQPRAQDEDRASKTIGQADSIVKCLPADIRALPSWLVWRYEHHPGEPKPRKVPYYASGGRRQGKQGSPPDRAKLVPYDAARAAAQGFDGVGLAMLSDNGLVALDFDDCIVDGRIAPEVEALVAGTYAERSPSGRGVRAFLRGTLKDRKDHGAGFEVFHGAGFVTVSGDTLPGVDLIGEYVAPLSDAVRAKYAAHFGRAEAANDARPHDQSRLGLTPGQMRHALTHIDPDCGYGEWIKAGMACHHESAGQFYGLDVWDEWSARGTKYQGRGELAAKWDSFGRDRQSLITGRWLMAQANVASPDDFEDLTAQIARDRASGALLGPTASLLPADALTAPPAEPPVVVDRYLLADAGGLVAPGSTGKTTLALFESVHIILGQPLYGLEVKRPGAVLFITAEDRRDTIADRLNRVCRDMGLAADDVERVRAAFYLEDISTQSVRLVAATRGGELKQMPLVGEVIEKYRDAGVAYLHLDPVSLIGPGEQSANDGMAELNRAARRIAYEFGCAVRLVHHVSKQVARENTTDQYAGRGGTAFADNSRFQHQLARVDKRTLPLHEGATYVVPPEISDAEIVDGAVLALYVHKLSYQKRSPAPIFLVRRGFRFDHYAPNVKARSDGTSEEERSARVEQVATFLSTEAEKGIRYNAGELERHARTLGMSRNDLRAAVHEGLQTSRLERRQVAGHAGKGAPPTYLAVLEQPL